MEVPSLRAGLMLIYHTTTAYLAAIVFGAMIFDQIIETATFSLLLGLLCSIPCWWYCGTKYSHILDLFASTKNGKPERLAKVVVMLTVFGSWIGAIVLPLDWERWWQVWPISNCISMIIFSAIGWITNFTVFKYFPSLLPFASVLRISEP